MAAERLAVYAVGSARHGAPWSSEPVRRALADTCEMHRCGRHAVCKVDARSAAVLPEYRVKWIVSDARNRIKVDCLREVRVRRGAIVLESTGTHVHEASVA